MNPAKAHGLDCCRSHQLPPQCGVNRGLTNGCASLNLRRHCEYNYFCRRAGKSKPDRTGAASKAVVTCGTTSANLSDEALLCLSSPAAALVEHPPATRRERKIMPSSVRAPSPVLLDDTCEPLPSWVLLQANTPKAVVATQSCDTLSPRGTARIMPTKTSTAASYLRTPHPRRSKPAGRDTGGVECTQPEHCIVKVGVRHSEKFEDRATPMQEKWRREETSTRGAR